MKYSAVALAAFVAVASAQADISMIPECAQPCINEATAKSTKCEATDFKCICTNVEEIVPAATTCVLEECGNAVALNEVLPATEKFCKAVLAGGDEVVTTTSAAAEPSSSAAPVESSAPASDEPVETSSAAPSAYPTAETTLTQSVVPTESAEPTGASSAAPSSTSPVTAGAASVAGSLGLLVLGAVAAL
ncbi:hypothetical protein V8F20_011357 [Naviculisporaceae sp. PSN 640]